MNKFNLLTLINLFALLTVLGTAWAEDIDWKEYQNKQYAYAISVPESWDIKERYEKTVMLAVSPKQNRRDRFRENINLNVQVVPNTINLDKYYKKNIRDMREYLSDFEKHSSGEIRMDGIKSKYMLYSHKVGNIRAKVLEVMFLSGSLGYKITCTALDNTFEDYKKIFKRILGTFYFIN